jgi:tRNA (guanine37-N1)-methyltransferase
MRFEIVTIFPGFFSSFFENGILRRALAEGLVEIGVHDLRAFTHDRHRTVDDRPFGGGEGMVLKPQPIAECLASLGIEPKPGPVPAKSESPTQGDSEGSALCQGMTAEAPCQGTTSVVPKIPHLEEWALAPEGTQSRNPQPAKRPFVVLLSAQGRPFMQALARELAALDRVVLICGRYEGVDERINQLYCDMELSIGDYVLSGGELAAAVVIDAAMRLIPGVLGNEASSEFESFGVADEEIAADEEGIPRSQYGAGGLLDYPHYTRPAEFAGLRAPEVLLNGDHLEIRRWRREQQLRKTLANRPDLLEQARRTGALGPEDLNLLDRLQVR